MGDTQTSSETLDAFQDSNNQDDAHDWDLGVKKDNKKNDESKKDTSDEPDEDDQANQGANNVSEAGLNFIAGLEGFSSKVYNDVAGLPTIGYGHLIKEGENFTTITKTQALQLLKSDVGFAVAAINKYVKVSLNQSQFDALTSFAYNVGTAHFSASSLLGNVNAGNRSSIENSFMMWNKATINGVLTPVDGLTNRRQAEAGLFLNGNY